MGSDGGGMSDDMTNLVLLAISAWCVWHFGRMLLAALATGALPTSSPGQKAATTRQDRPTAYWFFVALAAVFLMAFVWLIVSVLGDFAGFWEFRF